MNVDRLDVEVDRAPEPGFLRPTIEAVLAGRATGPGPERSVAEAVRDAVSAGRKPPTPPTEARPC